MSFIEIAVLFLRYAAPVLGWVLLLLAVLVYIRTGSGTPLALPGGRTFTREKSFRILLCTAGVSLFLGAVASTVVQYFVWSGSDFTERLLHSPLQGAFTSGLLARLFDIEGGYFAFFTSISIWLELLLAAFLAFVFWMLLKALRRHNDRFFEEGEVTLGLFAALLAGWPNVLLFVLFTFFSVVIVSVFRLIFMKEAYTTLGAPFLLALFLTLLAGPYFIELLGLSSMEVYRSS